MTLLKENIIYFIPFVYLIFLGIFMLDFVAGSGGVHVGLLGLY